MPTPSVSVPVIDLASTYDINDPAPSYTVPDAVVTPALGVVPAPTVAAAVTTPQPTSPTTSPTTQPATQPASQRHPDWLLRDAASLGLHPLMIERLDTNELTQYVMGELRSVRANHATNQVAAAVTNPQPQAATAQPGSQAAAVPSAPAAPAWDWGIHDDVDDMGRPVKRQFTDSDVHPALAHHVKEQAQRIAALESHLAALHQNAAAAGQSQLDRQFDASFNKLGGVFGTGTAASLQGKPELDKRVLVYNAVKAMFTSLPAAVRESMGIEKAVFTFAKSMFGVDAPAAAATPPGINGANGANGSSGHAANGQPTAEAFRSGGVGQPTQRRGNDSPHGRDKAIEEAQAWWKESQESGAIPQGGGTSLEEFFPLR